MRFRYMMLVMMVLFIVGGCAPIEGIDGDEDNLPEIGAENEGGMPDDEVSSLVEEAPEVEETVIPEVEPAMAAYVKITADALNVRKDSTLEADILTKVYEKQVYKVLDGKEDAAGLLWYQLEAPGKITGWVSSDYCIGAETYEELIEAIE